MANIRYLSTSIVRATANQESMQRIELTSSDLRLLLLGTIQKGLLFRRPQPSSQHTNLVQHLKTSISRTLDFFFPLAGRLATFRQDDTTICFFIDCNNAGAQFVHAVAENVTISDIPEPIHVPPMVHCFFPLNGVKNYEGVSEQLLAVQVTELADGIFIGCTMNHVVTDGATFWNFINSWSEISRGFDHIAKPPVFEHWFRSKSYCPVRLPLSIIKTDQAFSLPPLQERVFHFSKEKISGLKARANAEAGTGNISSLQSILAHIWQSAIRNRKLDDTNQETYLFLQVSVRSRSRPNIPEEYFGNVVQNGVVELKARDLLEHGLGYVALQINKTIASYTEDKVRKNLESWIKNPMLPTMADLKNTLGVSSSPRFNVYGNNFGWGSPIAVRSGPGNKIDGKLTVFPGVEEGSIDIELCISTQVLQAMGNDSQFMDAVTILS